MTTSYQLMHKISGAFVLPFAIKDRAFAEQLLAFAAADYSDGCYLHVYEEKPGEDKKRIGLIYPDDLKAERRLPAMAPMSAAGLFSSAAA